MPWRASESLTKRVKPSIRCSICQRRKHQLLGLFARQLPQSSFQTVVVPRGDVPRTEPGTATAQPKASALQPQLVWRGGSGSPLTATSAPLVLFLALHRRLRFPRRLQALWEANDTPVYGGCQYFNAIYCISILTREMRLSRAAFSTTYV